MTRLHLPTQRAPQRWRRGMRDDFRKQLAVEVAVNADYPDMVQERDALAARVRELQAYAKQADEALDEANKRCLSRGNRIAKLEAALRILADFDYAFADREIAWAALETK